LALKCLKAAIQVFIWACSPIAKLFYKHRMSNEDWNRHNRNIRGVANEIGLGD
jgi:hypothetical protein